MRTKSFAFSLFLVVNSAAGADVSSTTPGATGTTGATGVQSAPGSTVPNTTSPGAITDTNEAGRILPSLPQNSSRIGTDAMGADSTATRSSSDPARRSSRRLRADDECRNVNGRTECRPERRARKRIRVPADGTTFPIPETRPTPDSRSQPEDDGETGTPASP